MEFIGVTRIRDGKETSEFVARCPVHDWYYKGRPPVGTGCPDCWLVYFTCQLAQAGGDFKTNLDQLESAIRHVAEDVDKGRWDFKPELGVFIDHEDDE